MKLREIADRLNCRLEGDGDIEIRGVAGIEQAQPGDLTFIAHEKYVGKLATTPVSAKSVPKAANGSRSASRSLALKLVHAAPARSQSRGLERACRSASNATSTSGTAKSAPGSAGSWCTASVPSNQAPPATTIGAGARRGGSAAVALARRASIRRP